MQKKNHIWFQNYISSTTYFIQLHILLNKFVGFWIESLTFKLSDFQVRGDQIGPALVHLHMQSSIMGAGVMVQYILPLEPMLQKVVHLFFTAPGWSPVYAKLVLWGESGDYLFFLLQIREYFIFFGYYIIFNMYYSFFLIFIFIL